MNAIDVQTLVEEWKRNKQASDIITDRNREISRQLAEIATYKPGSDTGKIEAGNLKVTITKRVNENWDQGKLEEARSKLTDDLFFRVFKWKFEPKGKRELSAFLDSTSSEFRSSILSACTYSPGQPSMKVEEVEA